MINFYKFCEILGESWNTRPENIADFKYHYGGEPGEDYESPEVHGRLEVSKKLIFSNGVFSDEETGAVFPPIYDQKINQIIGESDDTYTMVSDINVVAELAGPEDLPEMNNLRYEIDGFYIQNDRTGKDAGLPDAAIVDKIFALEGDAKLRVPYLIRCDLVGTSRLSVSVVANPK